MTEEIKDILDFLLYNDKLTTSGKRKLRDYITNLQQENERIKKMNMYEHKYGSDMEGKYLIEKTKNDRAVEYIKKEVIPYGNEWHWDDGGIRYYVEEVLNILNGRSDE